MEKRILQFLTGTLIAGLLSIVVVQQKNINRWKKEAKKNRGLFVLLNQWLNLKRSEKHLEMYFKKKGLKKIAIYGMGNVGFQLVKELKESDIEVVYGIDRNADHIYSKLDIVTMNHNLPAVDAVVITLIEEYNEILEKLSTKMSCPIIFIEDILNEI